VPLRRVIAFSNRNNIASCWKYVHWNEIIAGSAARGSVAKHRSCGCGLQLKCDGTRRCTGGEVKGKLANALGSQYPSHYLGTWCIQHYYRWYAHLGCQQSTELTPPGRFKWTRPFRWKTKSGFCACAITFQKQSTLKCVQNITWYLTFLTLHTVVVGTVRSLLRSRPHGQAKLYLFQKHELYLERESIAIEWFERNLLLLNI